MKQVPHNIYIHVPFCMAKCNYCAFFSCACESPDWAKYTKSICDEIDYWGQKLEHTKVPTVFFGGGTPSLIPVKYFAQIMQCIRQQFDIESDAEITIEANPKTLNRERLCDFMKSGVNRISIGVQSFDDDKLLFLGRRHNAKEARELLTTAQDLGLRVSADFIYGLPDEGVTDVIKMCETINLLGLKHCSMYELTIEPNTPFGKIKLDMPDNDTMSHMYMAINDNLKIPRYEVSNYAIVGHECRHNQNIWDGAAYVGIGAGAAGRVNIDSQWYEQMGNHVRFDAISAQTRAIEKLITGMRTVRGCRLTDDVKSVIDIGWVQRNPEHVQIQNGRIATTHAGLMVLDEILVKMVK